MITGFPFPVRDCFRLRWKEVKLRGKDAGGHGREYSRLPTGSRLCPLQPSLAPAPCELTAARVRCLETHPGLPSDPCPLITNPVNAGIMVLPPASWPGPSQRLQSPLGNGLWCLLVFTPLHLIQLSTQLPGL